MLRRCTVYGNLLNLFSGVDHYKIHAVDSGSPDEGKKALFLAVQSVHTLSRSDVRESQSSPQEEGRDLVL